MGFLVLFSKHSMLFAIWDIEELKNPREKMTIALLKGIVIQGQKD
jgi:hypothetical protein